MGLFNFKKEEVTDEVQEVVQEYSTAGDAVRSVRGDDDGTENTDTTVTEDTNNGVYSFGSANGYPNALVDLYDSSPTHQAIVNRTAQMIAGSSVEEVINSDELMDVVHSKMLLMNPNSEQNLKDIVELLAMDLKLHGRYAILCGWNDAHDKVVTLKAVSVEGVRVGIYKNGKIPFYKHSNDWKDSSITPKIYYPYDKYGTESTQLLYVQKMRSGHLIYGLPNYYASSNAIAIEAGIGESHRESVDNGFSPKVAIVFPSKPSSTDIEDKIVKKINTNYAGRFGRRVLAIFAPNPTLVPEVKPIDVRNLHDQYIAVNDQTQASILTGHGAVSPRMFGIKTSSSLSGGNELESAFTIYQNTVVAPDSDVIVRSLNRIMQDSDNPNRFAIIPFNLFSSIVTGAEDDGGGSNKVLDALNSVSPLVASKILDNLTPNQIIGLVGLPPQDGGDEIRVRLNKQE